MADASIWGGLGDAPTFERGTWFNPGSIHDVQITRCLSKASQASGVGFIAECDILTSTQSGEINEQTRQPWIPLPTGTSGTWWQGMTDKNVAQPAIKGFVHAVLGLEANDPRRGALEQKIPGSERWACNTSRRPLALIESLMIWATEEPNILQGLFVHLDTRHTKTRKNTDFTIHNWSPINYAAMGMQPPNVDAILSRAWGEPPVNQAPQGPPPNQAPAWGQPPPPAQGPGYGQPPPAWGPPPQGPPPYQPTPQGPPPAWGPPPGPPPAQNWGQPPPQGPPPGYGPPPQNWPRR